MPRPGCCRFTIHPALGAVFRITRQSKGFQHTALTFTSILRQVKNNCAKGKQVRVNEGAQADDTREGRLGEQAISDYLMLVCE